MIAGINVNMYDDTTIAMLAMLRENDAARAICSTILWQKTAIKMENLSCFSGSIDAAISSAIIFS